MRTLPPQSPVPWPVSTNTGTSITLALTDNRKLISCTSDSAVTITVPPQASVLWGANSEILIMQSGIGQVTVVGGSGVTVNTSQTLKTYGRYATITLKRMASDSWVCGGEREAA